MLRPSSPSLPSSWKTILVLLYSKLFTTYPKFHGVQPAPQVSQWPNIVEITFKVMCWIPMTSGILQTSHGVASNMACRKIPCFVRFSQLESSTSIGISEDFPMMFPWKPSFFQGYRLRFLEEESDLLWLPLQETLMLVIRGRERIHKKWGIYGDSCSCSCSCCCCCVPSFSPSRLSSSKLCSTCNGMQFLCLCTYISKYTHIIIICFNIYVYSYLYVCVYIYKYIHAYWCFVQMLCMVEIPSWVTSRMNICEAAIFQCAFRQWSLAMIYLIYVCTWSI